MYSSKSLKEFTYSVFRAIGCSSVDACIASEVLSQADLRGVDSHGVARLSGYVRLWEKKRLHAQPKMKVVHETPSTAVLDADLAMGLVSAQKGMQVAIEKAKTVGSGWVAIKNSNHFGIAAAHSMVALEENMIGFAMTNASPLVAPTFSKSKLLGTNPISVAIPTAKQPPLVIDLATTPAANGKLEVLQRAGENAPKGWAQDAEGNPSIDASILKKGGAMLPLGSDRQHGSHKGYCLGSWVDIFSGILSGANYGPWVPPFVAFLDPLENLVGEGLGHFVGVWRVDAFRPVDEFKKHMDQWIETFRNAKPTGDEKVLIPGDPERLLTAKRLKEGVPVQPQVIDDLKQLANKLDITFSIEKQ
ncbi:malate dehydrogenase (NAD) [Balneicella halophila]|uniref:Malate dehydrogenase (NAD) n=1 Tax=Balneicella halophila TaxID=1537566 RepID=A0A7L4US76_BALHA|nr:Ldh family oxidoreductase [Balneicella halophila]PVX51804.1 malate dehydrogenase (NAD) [Balneicella halophila]